MTDLTEAEKFVLDVFNDQNAAVKAIELASLCARQMSDYDVDISSEAMVDAIYSLIEKRLIIEIEYPDFQIPDRLKSFLLPAATQGFRVNGISVFAMSKTETGFAIDFKPIIGGQHDR